MRKNAQSPAKVKIRAARSRAIGTSASSSLCPMPCPRRFSATRIIAQMIAHDLAVPQLGNFRGGRGAQGRNRTTDTRIFSPLLYQLSYLGALKKASRVIGKTAKTVHTESGAFRPA